MTEDTSNLGVYLSELYKNLNIISSQLENLIDDPNDIETLDNETMEIMEQRFTEWMGSFYNILIYLFCSSIAFLAALVEPEFSTLPVSMMIFFPFYLWLTFLYSIPEIKVGEKVVLSRKNLTIRKQIELAKSLFIFFIKQMYENSKKGIVIMAIYVLFLAIVLTDQYIFSLY